MFDFFFQLEQTMHIDSYFVIIYLLEEDFRVVEDFQVVI